MARSDETPVAIAGLLAFSLGWLLGLGFYRDVVSGREPVFGAVEPKIEAPVRLGPCVLRPDAGVQGWLEWLDCELNQPRQ